MTCLGVNNLKFRRSKWAEGRFKELGRKENESKGDGKDEKPLLPGDLIVFPQNQSNQKRLTYTLFDNDQPKKTPKRITKSLKTQIPLETLPTSMIGRVREHCPRIMSAVQALRLQVKKKAPIPSLRGAAVQALIPSLRGAAVQALIPSLRGAAVQALIPSLRGAAVQVLIQVYVGSSSGSNSKSTGQQFRNDFFTVFAYFKTSEDRRRYERVMG